jgi:PIN domain nuclease of toxin-antitoxin system
MGCDEMSTGTLRGNQDLLLLDTHVLIWLMFGESKLGSRAKAEIARVGDAGNLHVSAITPWEIGVLVSKKRIDLRRDTLVWIREALSMPGVSLIPLDPEIAVASARLPFEMHSDPADRILVATARQLGAALVTADKTLLDLAKKGYFRAMDAAR